MRLIFVVIFTVALFVNLYFFGNPFSNYFLDQSYESDRNLVERVGQNKHKSVNVKNSVVESNSKNELVKSPAYSFEGMDKSMHEMWVVDDEKIISEICDLFNSINRIYIADGHNRMDALL